MKNYFENLSRVLLRREFKTLNKIEKKVLESIVEKKSVVKDVNETFSETLTFGERVADRIAAFGGSWHFILLFFAFITIWIAVNSSLLLASTSFDPFPYILLNLGLSSLAAFQAPIIMMSQNRQAAKDRVEQKAMYEINLKIELELMRLHQRLDGLVDKDR